MWLQVCILCLLSSFLVSLESYSIIIHKISPKIYRNYGKNNLFRGINLSLKKSEENDDFEEEFNEILNVEETGLARFNRQQKEEEEENLKIIKKKKSNPNKKKNPSFQGAINKWEVVNRALVAGVFVAGIGAGITIDSAINTNPKDLASRDAIDRNAPNPRQGRMALYTVLYILYTCICIVFISCCINM